MAEFPDLGRNCQVKNCNILDFLPFQCNHCDKTYCLQHRQPTEHECTGLLSSSISNSSSVCLSAQSLEHCTFNGCQNQEFVSVNCSFCAQTFCLKHRHQQDHDCINMERPDCIPSKTSALVKSILDSKSGSQKQNVHLCNKGTTKLSAQVNLMKIKLNAIGEKSIPSSDRIYISVKLPNTSITKNYYFAKKWTIGKLVDYVASNTNIANLNNVTTAKKLRLFKDDKSESYPMHSTLNELMENDTIINGQSVILKYDA